MKKRLFFSLYVDDIKLPGKKQNIIPMWKVLNKDLGEPSNMFESRISAGATEKLPCSENLSISSWSKDMDGHAKKCVERYCELANKTTQQLYEIPNPCIDGHLFKEELKSVGELSQVRSQIVLKN